jgi:hypothetical protein
MRSTPTESLRLKENSTSLLWILRYFVVQLEFLGLIRFGWRGGNGALGYFVLSAIAAAEGEIPRAAKTAAR